MCQYLGVYNTFVRSNIYTSKNRAFLKVDVRFGCFFAALLSYYKLSFYICFSTNLSALSLQASTKATCKCGYKTTGIVYTRF